MFIYLVCAEEAAPVAKKLARMRRDMRVKDLLPFSGAVSAANPEGRILLAVSNRAGVRQIFDVTTRGAQFYGPGTHCYCTLCYTIHVQCCWLMI